MDNSTYFESNRTPVKGDLITENGKDSPCIVTRVYGYRFERVRIGLKAKAFKPVVSGWNKPASGYTFIEHQDNVAWPCEYKDPVSFIMGDIFKSPNDNYLMYTGDIKNGDWQFIHLADDDPSIMNFMEKHVSETFTYVVNQNNIEVPNYTLESLKFLFKDGHYPEMGDIYSDKYNACYQIVDMPMFGNDVKSVKLAAMSPKSYHSKDDDWPMYLYKEKSAYDFFTNAKFQGTPEETKHAPNIGDIYQYANDVGNGDVYILVIDVKDKYLAPRTIYIDEGSFATSLPQGFKWDSLEQFITSGSDGYGWKFIQNQEDFDVTFPPFKPTEVKFLLNPLKKEDVKLGALIVYNPQADVYHDGMVVTVGSEGFSVWWLAFEGGEAELAEGFKQAFKFDKHLPLFLYNGHQHDFMEKGQPILEVDMKEMEETIVKDMSHDLSLNIGVPPEKDYTLGVGDKPSIKTGQIIDFTTIQGNTTTCLIIKILTPNTFELVIIDNEYNTYSPIEYTFMDYFETKEWSFVQHQDDTAYDNLLAVKPLYEESINETPMTVDEGLHPKDVTWLKSGKVQGIIMHNVNYSLVQKIPPLMEGMILNYYPYKDMKPIAGKSEFWTLLVVEINDADFKVLALDKNGEVYEGLDFYFFSHSTYLMGKKGSLKYVMHMNDTALLSDDDENAYTSFLDSVKYAPVK